MKNWLSLALFGLLASTAWATPPQVRVSLTATPHSVTLSWATYPVTGTLFIVSRVPCTGTFTPGSNPNVGTCTQDGTPVTILATTGVNATSATDTSVTGGTVYDYYVQATCTGTGAACPAPYTGAPPSANSAEVAALIPPNALPPPTLSITSVAEVIDPTGTTETITAQWSDTTVPNIEDYFAFTNGSKFMNQGLTSSPSGTFAEIYIGPVQPQNFFVVCNALTTCISVQVFAPDASNGPQV